MEKEKNKRGEVRRVSKAVTFTGLAIVLSIAFFFATFFLFDAYGLLEIYDALSIPTAVVLTIFLVVLLLIGCFTVHRLSERIVLGLAALAVTWCAYSGVAFLLAWFSMFTLPLLLIILVGFGLALIFRPEPFSVSVFLASLVIASIFVINLIMLQEYEMLRYDLHESTNIKGHTYHLISVTERDDFYSTPFVHIRLYKCNAIGLFCDDVYAPDDYYYYNYRFTWEIVDEGEITITIFVSGYENYQYLVK